MRAALIWIVIVAVFFVARFVDDRDATRKVAVQSAYEVWLHQELATCRANQVVMYPIGDPIAQATDSVRFSLWMRLAKRPTASFDSLIGEARRQGWSDGFMDGMEAERRSDSLRAASKP